jgi:hypothetical protein
MNQYPSFDEALDGLGDKVVRGLVDAVESTQIDYLMYRMEHPDWVRDASPRGMANWIHDIMWAHAARSLDDTPGVYLVDKGPTREIVVGFNYRIRVKRHDEHGAVSNYLTPSAIGFFEQDEPAFEGMEELRLIAGYVWLADTMDIGEAVLSLRDGKDRIVWMNALPTASAMPTAQPLNPTASPTPPTVTLKADVADESQEETGT